MSMAAPTWTEKGLQRRLLKLTFENLFTPIKIGTIEVKNRIVMPPMTSNFASETGAANQRVIDYYVERAKGGAGLIIVEATCIDSPVGRLDDPLQLCIDDDMFIAGFNDLCEAVHETDTKIALQLHHAGRETTLEITQGIQPVSASDVYCAATNTKPRPLTTSEVETVVEKYAQGAKRAKTAGFDAVEMHSAHGYLIQQFLSPATNKRTDRYGGDPNRRMQFVTEIIERTRELVGPHFPILLRLSAHEYIEDGLTLDDTKIIAKKLQDLGLNGLDVSAGTYDSPFEKGSTQPMVVPPGFMINLAGGIKSVVDIPVITVGRINDPVFADEILKSKKADMVAMGRALIADPHLPSKAEQGRTEGINMCIACMRCSERTSSGLRLKCAVNVNVGKERENRLQPAEKPKRVLIIGGGPAGMEAARTLSLRGHEVVLYEKEVLGGQMNLASVPPGKTEIKNLIRYLVNQLKEQEVEVHIGQEASLQNVEPDEVIVATGSVPLVPRIRGINRTSVVTAWDVLRDTVKIGSNVVVAGGGMVGCETSEYLADKGKKVTVVEMLSDIGLDMESKTRKYLLKSFDQLSVVVHRKTKIEEITENGVKVTDSTGKTGELAADTVVLALGACPNRKVLGQVAERFDNYWLIGDCVKPCKILEAIHDGARIGRKL